MTGGDLDTLDHLVGRACWYAGGRRTRPPGCRCSRRSAPTPPSASRQPTTAMPSASTTTGISSRSPSANGNEQALMGVDRKQHLTRLVRRFTLRRRPCWAVGRLDAGPALAMVAALARIGTCGDSYADAVEWIDRRWLCRRGGPPGRAGPRAPGQAVACDGAGASPSSPHPRQGSSRRPRVGDPLLLAKVLNRGFRHVGGRRPVRHRGCGRDEARRSATAQATSGRCPSVGRKGERCFNPQSCASASIEPPRCLEESERGRARPAVLRCRLGALAMGGDRDARMLADRAVPLVRDLDKPGTWMILLWQHRSCRPADRRHDRRPRCLSRGARALPFARRLRLPRRPPRDCGVAVVHGDLSHAARLRGAAAAHRHGVAAGRRRGKARGGVLRERPHAPTESTHGKPPSAEGGQLSFDAAIAYALDQRRALPRTAPLRPDLDSTARSCRLLARASQPPSTDPRRDVKRVCPPGSARANVTTTPTA